MTEPANSDSDLSESTHASAANPAESSVPKPGAKPGAKDASTVAMSPRDRFEQHVAEKRDSLDDHEPEKSLWSGRYSPKSMVGYWVTLTVVSIALIIASIALVQLTFGVALLIIAILWVLVVANYARMRLGFCYELTSQRFIHKRGLLTRRTDRIEVIDIDDVSYEQGPIQRLLGVGSINITSSDRSDPELHLLGIDKVSEVAGLIDDVRRAERRRRSLHIESI